MRGGEGEPGASVPWAERLHAGRQTGEDRFGLAEPKRGLSPFASASPEQRPPAPAPGPEGEALPWLEAPDDFDDEDAGSRRGLARLALGAAVLGAIVGTAWWMVQPGGAGEPDGSLIRAESGPYKVRPQAPGGKTFAGTGDSAYAVSEGESRGAALGYEGTRGEGSAEEIDGGDPSRAGAAPAGGAGVQVGAFMDPAAAEAGWTTLVQRTPILSGFGHRVVAGPGDIGTVYRLQAVTNSAAAATELCRALTEAGQECRVRP
jgi:hypothetical protein